MARPTLGIGEYGRISVKRQPDGRYRALVRYRDQTGTVRQTNAFGNSIDAAERAVKKQAQDLANGTVASGGITPATTIAKLAEIWLDQIASDGKLKPQTVTDYRWHVDKVICGPGGIANIKVREATTGRIDTYIRGLAETRPSVARKCRTILGMMLALAARHGAVATNPVRDVSTVRKPKSDKRTLSVEQLRQLRDQITSWQAGDAIPGRTAAPRGGQGRSHDVLDYLDLYLATGARTAEILALRWSDVNLAGDPCTVVITGTVVQRAKADGGLTWQPEPKTESGYREIPLPAFAVAVLMRRQQDAKAGAIYVFASQTGGLRSPANMRRQLREARGTSFDWITPRVMRKTTLSTVAAAVSDQAAARQAGHSGEDVTRRHYISRPAMVPDNTAVLSALGPVAKAVPDPKRDVNAT